MTTAAESLGGNDPRDLVPEEKDKGYADKGGHLRRSQENKKGKNPKTS